MEPTVMGVERHRMEVQTVYLLENRCVCKALCGTFSNNFHSFTNKSLNYF